MPWNDIWQADMRGNGLQPYIKGVSEQEKDDTKGYIIVDLSPIDASNEALEGRRRNHSIANVGRREIKVLAEVSIPEKKKHSFQLIQKIFDNYFVGGKMKEISNPAEEKEILEFLKFAIATEPMKIARKFVESKGIDGASGSDEEWIDYLIEVWFKTYYKGSTSAFEHIFCGEQGITKHKKLNGHHFWYHYYLHDGPFEVTKYDDTIYFVKHVEVKRAETSNRAEVITVKYQYTAFDDSASQGLLLYKDIGGFFVGISGEALLAFGTVANVDGRSTIPITINGEDYDVMAFDTKDGEHFRTFYPKIKN